MSRELDIITKAKLTFTKYKTLRDLSSAVLSNEYNEKSLNFSRILIWKFLIIFNEKSLQEIPIPQLIDTQVHNLTRQRTQFQKELNNCDIPWDHLPRDSIYFQEQVLLEADIGTTKRTPVLIDPLTQDPVRDNDFHLQLIILDVERLFPQEPELFVENFTNKKMVIEVLYYYYIKNGIYRQGMHELIGFIFKSFINETLSLPPRSQYHEPLELQLYNIYDSQYQQCDLFIVFNKLIPHMLDSYYDETCLLQESIKFDLKLHELDQMLYHILLTKLKIQTPIWILRYMRLVLLRELGIQKTLIIWDKFIAFGNDDITKLLPFFIILMLLKLRNFILENEHDDILYLLLHYPADAELTQLDAMVQDCILLYNSEANLKMLSKIMIYKYCRDDADKNDTLLRRKFTGKRSSSMKKNSADQRQQPPVDDSIGGNQINVVKSKDFERTRLELRLAKRVNDLLKKK